MRSTTALLFCFFVSFCFSLEEYASEPVVTTSSGPVKGIVDDGVRLFRGIPYAQPPLADRRFKRPVPVTPWTETLDATKPSEKCAQLHIVGPVIMGSEDCLTLDVYAPVNASGLPVMLFIHGGGFLIGNSKKYDGTNLARKYNVVVVAIQYRVDVLGFYAAAALGKEDPDGIVGNYGLLDQQLAMKWAKKNAGVFGGDENQILLFGQSAGAMSTCAHIAMPSSSGLFHSVIMESGTCDAKEFFLDYNQATSFGLEYADYVGCNETTTGVDMLQCMRGLPVAQLFVPIITWLKQGPKWTSNSPPLTPIFTFVPVVDGHENGLPMLPLTAIKQGKANLVPTIMGITKDEGMFFGPLVPFIVPHTHYPTTSHDLRKAIAHLFGDNSVDFILQRYPASNKTIAPFDSTHRLADIIRDYIFACGTRRTARAIAAAGNPMYTYEFAYPLRSSMGKFLGDYHCSEVQFVFQNRNKGKEDIRMEAIMGDYWTNFAKYSNPNGLEDQVFWPQFEVDSKQPTDTAILTDPVQINLGFKDDICDFWDARYQQDHSNN